ncbi:hypothetical protein TWF694_006220 [Orbilia ellipsospora]|uniref:Reverse transcriptase domain-containing protein n=1 Tax=Orbilia ellipsospora TaxID=2528407 RepID=A0AAV9XJH1_9PEZI
MTVGVKLEELYKRNGEIGKHLVPILKRLEEASTEKEKLQILIEERAKLLKKDVNIDTQFFEHFDSSSDVLAMSKIDPTISDAVFKHTRVRAEESICRQLNKSKYATLFSSIFQEWMTFEGKSAIPNLEDDDADDIKTPKSDEDSTVEFPISRPEKVAQMEELQKIIFAPNPIAKPEEYIKYLEELFKEAEEDAKKNAPKKPTLDLSLDDDDIFRDDEVMPEPGDEDGEGKTNSTDSDPDNYLHNYVSRHESFKLKNLRNTIGRYGGTLRKHERLQKLDVKQAIHGLVSGELLTEAKKTACKEILLSDVILEEIAMVLTLRLREIENWKYADPAIQLNFRRHLNGKYRCYADEPLLDAIFLQWIGVKWGMELRRVLEILHQSASWARPKDPIDAARQEVRTMMIPREEKKISLDSIATQRKKFMKEFFLTLLPESIYDFRAYNEDGQLADQEKKDNEKIRRARNEELKQMLLQRLLIDRQYSEAINPGKQFTVVQADAYRFAQSQSHEIILALMKFIGVPKTWLKFFETFLKLPALVGGWTSPRESKRGVPISHPLGLVFGEVQLFFMEFAVNRATGGRLGVFRMHDDFWWWGSDEKECEVAWKTIGQYSALAGTEWNLEKSGCVRMSAKPTNIDISGSTLPSGDISWGFIKLGSEGVWKIKDDEVDKHIKEMKIQMDSQKSILGLIDAYNRYMKFFVRNFGKPARVFGKQHVEQIVTAVNKINASIIPSEYNGDFVSYIKSIVKSRFGHELTEEPLTAWILMPVTHGGLGVRNVLFDINPILRAYTFEEEDHEASKKYDDLYHPRTFKRCLKKDKIEYETAKEAWLKRARPIKGAWENDIPDEWFDGMEEWLASRDTARSSRRRRQQHPFLTFEEFILGRQNKFTYWGEVWSELSETPNSTRRFQFPDRISKALLASTICTHDSNWLKPNYDKTSPYWRSFLLSFGEQLLDAFGDFKLVDEGRLPVAMIDIYTNLKTKWDQ